MKFKVGDRVKFVKSTYGHSSDVKVGEIYKIKTVDTTGIPYQTENLEWFMEEELESVEYTYEDLKKSPIGTKVTFEDGVLIKVAENYYKEDYQDGRFRNNKDLKGLKDNFGVFNLGKIIKIEEPIYQTVYEYKPEILDETEKRYLRGVIRPFRDKVKYIKKYFSRTVGKEYLQVKLKEDRPMNLPYFEVNAMYKGMKKEKEYTLEELGL